MKRILRCLRGRSGAMLPLTAAVFLAVLLLLAFSMELWRLHAVTNGVYKAVRAGAETAVAENAGALYASETDMAAGAFVRTDSGWADGTDLSALSALFSGRLGLRQSGPDWIRYDGSGREQYRLSDVEIRVSNPYAPPGPAESAPAFTVTVGWKLQTSFLGFPVSVPMKVRAGVGKKF